MADIIEFKKPEEKVPHLEGPAICLDCKHEWHAVLPKEELNGIDDWLECPSCSLHKGRLRYPFQTTKPHWECVCGNQLFCITQDCTYCPNCGREQNFP